jgi:hypothetical protein
MILAERDDHDRFGAGLEAAVAVYGQPGRPSPEASS